MAFQARRFICLPHKPHERVTSTRTISVTMSTTVYLAASSSSWNLHSRSMLRRGIK